MLPLDPKDVPFFAPDFVEFLAVFIVMGIAFGILVALGHWWQR
ncbi:MAG: hypothetical protein U1B78_08085 [Dehalococcoidia bacterium]|nr:hypothetical protein [Dehalococcoidia bacterium]